MTRWKIIAILSLVAASFIFNSSLRKTFSRRKAIRETQVQIKTVTKEAEALQHKIAVLKTSATLQEKAVRSELGYLRPGEKEVRFMLKSTAVEN